MRGGGQPAVYRGMIQTALGIVREEVGVGIMTLDSHSRLAAFISRRDERVETSLTDC